jgi:hypothetical protein
MKKITNVVLKIVLALMMIMPILGTLGIFPAPTRDLYNTDLAFNFIEMLMNVGYINWMMGVVFFISLILIIKKQNGTCGTATSSNHTKHCWISRVY